MKKRLAIITTHPIQYNAPLFALLSKRGTINVKVFYTWGEAVMKDKTDPGFGRIIEWDIPLLDGYEFGFIQNIASDPGSHHYKGIDNPGLIRAIYSWKADRVLVYGWNFKSHLRTIVHFKGRIPVLFRGDSILTAGQNKIKAIAKRIFLKWLYTHVDTALYTGTLNKEYFMKHGIEQNKLVFVPHAVDNKRFGGGSAVMTAEAVVWRKDLGIGEDDTVFLFAGKFEPKKNPGLLAETFCSISDSHIKLVLAGSGILEKTLKNEFASEGRIIFLDFQNQSKMPLLYRMCDVFVLPSSGPGETWGLSINEAMASGRAVLVSSACGASADLVKSGINGYVFQSNDSAALKQKMELLISRKDELPEMGKASMAIISEWSFENDCNAIERICMD